LGGASVAIVREQQQASLFFVKCAELGVRAHDETESSECSASTTAANVNRTAYCLATTVVTDVTAFTAAATTAATLGG